MMESKETINERMKNGGKKDTCMEERELIGKKTKNDIKF
jgi:hypothetical protein